MTQNREQKKRLDYLLKEFKEDSVQYKDLEVKDNYNDKRMALRSLMNIRMPQHMSDDVLKVQDDFLKEEAKEKGIIKLADIPTVKKQERLSIWQGDITRLEVGAIVNAANSQMLGCFVPCHRCIDNAIHSAAGIQLREECNHIMIQRRLKYGKNYEEPVGTATLTKAYNLPCEYVIHTVGPIVYSRLNDALCQDLRNCYENVLKCCVKNNIKSVAFCCISTGEFHFPNDRAAEIAVETVTGFLKKNGNCMERIIFNVFKDNDLEIYENVLKQLSF